MSQLTSSASRSEDFQFSPDSFLGRRLSFDEKNEIDLTTVTRMDFASLVSPRMLQDAADSLEGLDWDCPQLFDRFFGRQKKQRPPPSSEQLVSAVRGLEDVADKTLQDPRKHKDALRIWFFDGK